MTDDLTGEPEYTDTPVNAQTYAGFVALIGAPNAGKSTLLNQMVGQKVSIVSRKVQTTRTQIRGILTTDNVQIVFVDTPGIFRPKKRLERAMVGSAWDGVHDADNIVFLIDAKRGLDNDDVGDIIQGLKQANLQVDIALNKIDTVAKEKLIELAQELKDNNIVKDIFMISALNGYGTEKLKTHLQSKMPVSPFLYDRDDVSDLHFGL
jgi:GTP-binding protein Era